MQSEYEVFDEFTQDADERKGLDTAIDMDIVEDENALQEDEVITGENSQITGEFYIVILTVDNKFVKFKGLFGKKPVKEPTIWDWFTALYEYLYGKEKPVSDKKTLLSLLKPKPKPKPSSKGDDPSYKAYIDNSVIKGIMLIAMIMELVTAVVLINVLMTPDVGNCLREINIAFIVPPIIFIFLLDFGFTYLPLGRKALSSFSLLMLTVLLTIFVFSMISCHLRTNILLYVVIVLAAIACTCLSLGCFNYPFARDHLMFKHMAGITFGTIALISLIDFVAKEFMGFIPLLIFFSLSTLLVFMFLLQLKLMVKGKTTKLKPDDTTYGAFMVYIALFDIPLKMLMDRIKKK